MGIAVGDRSGFQSRYDEQPGSYLEQYSLEKPCAAGLDGIGGGSGAFGGVALSRLGYMGEVALSVAAIIGALSVMALIVYVSQKVKGNVTLLIIGVMIGYVASAVIGVLKYFSVEEDIRAYVIWGLGSFARVSGDQMLLFVCIMAVLLPLSFLLIKTMNLLLLGDGYARNLGLNIKRARLLVISCSGVLVAIVTAYCGPIMFIGLAVPHLCRAIFHTSDHRILMPATLLVGACRDSRERCPSIR